MHWSCKYLNLSYRDYDCSELVEFVLKKERDIHFSFPRPGKNSAKRALAIFRNYKKFVHPEPVDVPQDFDAVIMSGAKRFNHIGLYFKNKGREYCLHSSAKWGMVVCHETHRLKTYGLKIEGYYRWQE